MESKATPFILKALNKMLREYKARQFTVIDIRSDREGGIYKLKDALAQGGIVLNDAGAGSHVGMIEIQNKLVKESCRMIINSLPYRLPKFLHRYLVYFCVSRRNLFPSNLSLDPTPPKELFTGRRLDRKIDVRIGFGEYVEVDAMPKHRNDINQPRTLPAISLDPRGNLQGSVRFFVIVDPEHSKSTKPCYSFVIRDKWVKMPINQVLIDKLNLMAYDNKTVYPPIELRDLDEEAHSERLDDALLRQPATGNVGENHTGFPCFTVKT